MTFLLRYENLFKVYETKEELRKKFTSFWAWILEIRFIFQLTYEGNVSVSFFDGILEVFHNNKLYILHIVQEYNIVTHENDSLTKQNC